MKAIVSGLACAVLVLGLLVASPVEAEGKGPVQKRIFTKHFNETLFDITGDASFSVEVLLDDEEYNIGKDVVGLVVHDKYDEDVAGAEIAFAYKDLETAETIPAEVEITDKGNGLYIISGLDLERDGRWELLISIKMGSLKDSVSFIFPDTLEKRYPKGRYSP